VFVSQHGGESMVIKFTVWTLHYSGIKELAKNKDGQWVTGHRPHQEFF